MNSFLLWLVLTGGQRKRLDRLVGSVRWYGRGRVEVALKAVMNPIQQIAFALLFICSWAASGAIACGMLYWITLAAFAL